MEEDDEDDASGSSIHFPLKHICKRQSMYNVMYRKVPKFSDAKKSCCNLPKVQTKRPNLTVFHQKDANGQQTVKTLIRLLL